MSTGPAAPHPPTTAPPLTLAAVVLAAACAVQRPRAEEPQPHRLEAFVPIRTADAPSPDAQYCSHHTGGKFWVQEPLPLEVTLQEARAGEVVVAGLWTVYYRLSDRTAAELAAALQHEPEIVLTWDRRPFWFYSARDSHLVDMRYVMHRQFTQQSAAAFATELMTESARH